MKHNPEKHDRRSIRLCGFDYSWVGYYFVTVRAQGRGLMFGWVVDGKMVLSREGRMADECWSAIPDHFPGIALDQYVIMPNHVHGIISIRSAPMSAEGNTTAKANTKRATHASPLPDGQPNAARPCGPKPRSLGSIVGSFKSAASKGINEMRGTPGAKVWQRNYYEHIIKNEQAYHAIRHYIAENPLNWQSDRENPSLTENVESVSPDDEPWRV